jgi:hypothetical protein
MQTEFGYNPQVTQDQPPNHEIHAHQETETIGVDTIFTFDEKNGFFKPQDYAIDHTPESKGTEQADLEKKQNYLKKLLSLQTFPEVKTKLGEVASKCERILSQTLEYYCFATRSTPMVGGWLESKLVTFNAEKAYELEEAGANQPRLNAKLIFRYIKKGDLLKAYEAFWGTWNPTTQPLTNTVYKALGGDKRPITATMGTFTYSGAVLHGFHPYAMPLFLLEAYAGVPEMIAAQVAVNTAAFAIMGIPVAFAKHRQQKQRLQDDRSKHTTRKEA